MLVKLLLCLFFLFFSACSQAVEPYAPKWYSVNLNDPPQQRYNEVCEDKILQIQSAITYMKNLFPDVAVRVAEKLGGVYADRIPEPFASEIKGIARCINATLDDVVFLNLFYEFSAACTSIVAKDSTGRIIHGRNLDFDFQEALAPMVVNINYYKNGKLLFKSTGFAGLVILLTGHRPNFGGFTFNERDANTSVETIVNTLESIYDGVLPGGWVGRVAMENSTTFQDMYNYVTTVDLVSRCYIIISGTSEGYVVTRDPDQTLNVWDLNKDAQDGWFLLQTNDDHWDKPTDDRREVGFSHMKQLGQANITPDTLYNSVLHQPTNYNDGTLYSSTFYVDDADSFNSLIVWPTPWTSSTLKEN